jgi:iron(III) transport system substrate-binding protein
MRLMVMLALAVIFLLSDGPGRAADQALIEAAKREGRLTWYTTQRPPFAIAAAEAFKARYGITVDHATYTSADVSLRIANEGRAGSMRADIFDGSDGVTKLKGEGLVLPWLPESAARLPARYVDPARYWAASNTYILSPAFNTNLVPKGGEPKTYEDFLDPKWRGKMVWSSTPTMSGAPGFIGLVLAHQGEEKGLAYLRRLAGQNLAAIMGGPAALNNIVTGEYPVNLQVFTRQVIDAAATGAPVDWIPSMPALAVFAVIGLPKNAPHPNAGKLMMDFLLSREGQQIYTSFGYVAVDPDIPLEDASMRAAAIDRKAHYFSPDQVAELLPKFAKIYEEIFR